MVAKAGCGQGVARGPRSEVKVSQGPKLEPWEETQRDGRKIPQRIKQRALSRVRGVTPSPWTFSENKEPAALAPAACSDLPLRRAPQPSQV